MLKTLLTTFVISLLIPITGMAQITIEASQKKRTEVSSPMKVTVPIVKTLPQMSLGYSASLFRTEELSTTVCDAVILKSVGATVVLNEKRTKGELTVVVTTYTEPPQDKTAFVTFRIKNDDEILMMPTAGFPNRDRISVKVKAEEKKTRSKLEKARFNPAQLDRILAGKNPRVEIILKVENDY